MTRNRYAEHLGSVFHGSWDRTAVVDAESGLSWSYRDLLGQMRGFRHKLMALGIKRGDRIITVMDNSVELLVMYFAVALCGAAIVPIDPLRGERDIRDMVTETDGKLIIVSDRHWNTYGTCTHILSSGFRLCSDRGASGSEAVKIFREIDCESDFLITYTSGSEGRAKGVVHTFHNLCASADAFRSRFGFGPPNVFYHSLPMAYMAGILNLIVLPMISGSTIILGNRFNAVSATNYWEFPVAFGVNTFWFTPTMLAMLLKLDRGRDGRRLSERGEVIGCVGTAPLGCQTKEGFSGEYGIRLYESYGLSETLFISTEYPGLDAKPASVGKPLSGVRIRVGSDSELMLAADWMFTRYLGDSNQAVFDGEYFQSGDLGCIDNKGRMYITGRKKDVIIKGGMNISPRRIEEFIRSLHRLNELVIVGIPDDTLGERIVCFYLGKKGGGRVLREVNSELVRGLGRDYSVDEFVHVGEIPRTINGKVDKKSLIQRYRKGDDN